MIKVNLIQNTGFAHRLTTANFVDASTTAQNQQFQSLSIQNGYGTATTVSVTPGYGATVTAVIDIQVNTITEAAFKSIVAQAKQSSQYQSNSDYASAVNSASYEKAGSSSSGIFGWLLGHNSSSFSNATSDVTSKINAYQGTAANSDATVANSIANIILKSQSKVQVQSTIQVTGKLLTPSPTILAIEMTTYQFKDQNGNTSTVTMLDQDPVVPVDQSTGTVSQNTLQPGAKVTLSAIPS